MSEHTAHHGDANQSTATPLPRWQLGLALLFMLGVTFALTLLKHVFVIGHLWHTSAHRHRGIELVPLEDLWNAPSLIGAVLNVAGNVALFLPLGYLLLLLWANQPHPVRRVATAAVALSAAIETAQYIFALGYTDIDDVLYNTLGAVLGAWLAQAIPMKFHRFVMALFLACGASIFGLYALSVSDR